MQKQLRIPKRDWEGRIRESVQGEGEKEWAVLRDEGDVQGSVTLKIYSILAKKSN